ncbi:L-aspartate oxidase [Luteitalea sp. TBR-22]|uniref:L-aspartate oxidase n=1 Tax=Luteitalea sp. TBR-22 TaxID=2802971 RepID=UPI001AF35D82|nr:L-aspartate oxidase [Luteitalea sp. TBR-22]BCS34550.1 L-aspartate oxidase [Luteitalea sp. TBR-22]
MTTTPDFLVLGSGIAALRAALALASRGRVCILTKGDPGQGSTVWAQGGIAAALGDDDSPSLHYEDTLAAGDGLCEPGAVRMLVEAGPAYVEELLAWGAAFDRLPDGRPSPTREAAHSVRRVFHAEDATGREISRVLHAQVAAAPAITLVDHAIVSDLIVEGGRCVGAAWHDADGMRHETRAAATLLATGGAGHVFSQTTNPAVITGDGMAMAFEAGAEVADLEFVQFHPTVLDVPGRARFLLSEALRGEGARLLNVHGEAFMTRYEAAAELAPRDRVARAIVRESQRTAAPVYLSLAHLTGLDVHGRFPQISDACREVGLDLARDPIPVSPAVHYVMGGVVTDLDGRTSVPGLYAAGEVACTGVHGANRLASNSLLEGLVFGARAGAVMGERPRARDAWNSDRLVVCDQPMPAAGGAWPEGLDAAVVRARAWRDLGLVRTPEGLREAESYFGRAWAARFAAPGEGLAAAQMRSLVTVAWLMGRAALRREESRGGHYRTDFPERRDDTWGHHCSDVLQRRAD